MRTKKRLADINSLHTKENSEVVNAIRRDMPVGTLRTFPVGAVYGRPGALGIFLNDVSHLPLGPHAHTDGSPYAAQPPAVLEPRYPANVTRVARRYFLIMVFSFAISIILHTESQIPNLVLYNENDSKKYFAQP